MMGMLAPFVLDPILAIKPWGGNRLAGYGKLVPEGVLVGESWEVADLDTQTTVGDGHSRVAGGPLSGMSLREVKDAYRNRLMGSAPADGPFPLLVKLLDATQHLSVQVHPDAGYADLHPETAVKTESWYVVDAAPGSELFIDVGEGVGRQEVVDALGTPDLVDLLVHIPAHPGDFHHLPAGIIHALGAGVLIAEVQTPSDTTFRMYDWNEEYGRPPRNMHLGEAAASLAIRPPGRIDSSRGAGPGSRLLVDSPAYRITELAGVAPGWNDAELRILMVIEGEISLGDLRVGRGSTVIVPAECAPDLRPETDDDSVLLEIGL